MKPLTVVVVVIGAAFVWYEFKSLGSTSSSGSQVIGADPSTANANAIPVASPVANAASVAASSFAQPALVGAGGAPGAAPSVLQNTQTSSGLFGTVTGLTQAASSNQELPPTSSLTSNVSSAVSQAPIRLAGNVLGSAAVPNVSTVATGTAAPIVNSSAAPTTELPVNLLSGITNTVNAAVSSVTTQSTPPATASIQPVATKIVSAVTSLPAKLASYVGISQVTAKKGKAQ